MDRLRDASERLLGPGDFLRPLEGLLDGRGLLLAKGGPRALAVAGPILRQAEIEAENLKTSEAAVAAARLEVERTALAVGASPLVAAEAALRAATFRNRGLVLQNGGEGDERTAV